MNVRDGQAPALVDQVLRSPGRPFDAASRAFFESRFGHDFSEVRVHADDEAAEAARMLDAHAFTLGTHIVFGEHQYAPGRSEGRHLLAHELTHVVQQASGSALKASLGGSTIQRQPACNTNAAPKTVDIYQVLLPGATRDPDADLARANTIWAQCGVSINSKGGQSWQTDVLDLDPPTGILNAPASTTRPLTREETTMFAHTPGGDDVIHAYYVPDFTGPKVAESFWPSQHGFRAVVVGNNARSDSFAHELGHVLLDSGNHEADADNLMASGGSRHVGVDHLECRQCP